MAKKHKRHFIKEKEVKALLQNASKKLRKDLETILNPKVIVELIIADPYEIFLINGRPLLFKDGENIYPTLLFEEALAFMPKVVVDMGAVRHICNGANVMAPGIVRFEGEFKKGDLVVVIDEKYDKPLALGEAQYDFDIANGIRQGVVVKNLHFVGDKVWKLVKEIG